MLSKNIMRMIMEKEYDWALCYIAHELNDIADEYRAAFETDEECFERIETYPGIGLEVKSLNRWYKFASDRGRERLNGTI